MERYNLFTSYMFKHSWHPLTGEIPEYFKCTGLTKQAILVIEESRNMWKCIPNNEKIKIAQKIWGYIVDVNYSETYRLGGSLLDSPSNEKSRAIEKCKEIILEIKKNYKSEVVNISDSEIAALYAINLACKVLKDYKNTEELGFDMTLYANRRHLEIGRDVAKTVLGWALHLQPKMEKPTIKNPDIEPNVFRWCGGTWEITFNGETIRPPDSKGLRYIHYLMYNPGKQINVLELVKTGLSSEKDNQAIRALSEKGKRTERLNKSTSGETDEDSVGKLYNDHKGDDVVDEISIEDYKRILPYLEEQIKAAEENGDLEEKEDLQERFNYIGTVNNFV